jgi:hypothetical protein
VIFELFGQDITVEFTPSALKRGYTEESLMMVFNNCVYDETLQEDPSKTLVIGFDENGKLTEMIFNVIEPTRIVVFHAMPCRKVYENRIGLKR